MKKRKLGQEAAFATSCENLQSEQTWQSGMSKRFYAACAAMQGLLGNPNTQLQMKEQFGEGITAEQAIQVACRTAFSLADELLRQEGGEE